MKTILLTICAIFLIGANLFAEFTLPNEFVYNQEGTRWNPLVTFQTQSGELIAKGSAETNRYELKDSEGQIITRLDNHPFTQSDLRSKSSLFIVRDDQENILGSFTFNQEGYTFTGVIFDQSGSRVGSISHDFWDLHISIINRYSQESLVVSLEKGSFTLSISKWPFKVTVLENRSFEEAAVDPRVIAAVLQVHGHPKGAVYKHVDQGEPLTEADLPNLAVPK